jgi:hypothetical protein
MVRTLKVYTREQLRAELERRGCTPHPNPGAVVVPFGEMWIHPNGVTRIVIPRAIDGGYPEEIVEDLLKQHDIPPRRPDN